MLRAKTSGCSTRRLGPILPVKIPSKSLTKLTQGVNVIRVTLEGAPYFETLGYDLWPWEAPERRQIGPP